jgi:hypothetical protein
MGVRDLLGAILFGIVCVAPAAHAQSNADRALAEALFQEGKRLMDTGKYADACDKLAESQRLDPATGTLLNLAACREAEGKLATAWLLFSEAASSARRDGREDRVEFAEGRIRDIEPKLSRISVEIPAESAIPELEVRLDGTALRRAAWGIPTAVDTGDHEIAASAPGHQPWSVRISITGYGELRTVSVPRLKSAASAGPPATLAAGSAAPRSTGAPASAQFTPMNGGSRPAGIPVLVAGGATIALAIGATATAFIAQKRAKDFDDANQDPDTSVRERRSLRDEAHAMQVLNTALTGGAVVGAVMTGVLFATRPPTRANAAARRAPRLSPWVTTDGAGVFYGGAL